MVKNRFIDQADVWKKACSVYEDLSSFSKQEAICQLKTLSLSPPLYNAVIELIESSSKNFDDFEKNLMESTANELFRSVNVGQKIKNYELIEEIGSGGMSQVYKAVLTGETHQKPVAIKIFSPKSHTKDLITHFLLEQKILSDLSHSNIVAMHHGGQCDNHTAYLVMELIESAMPINEYSIQHNWSQKKIIVNVIKCANAISYAHSNLIIHRDIKPENILINKDGKLKVVDFGIAKLIMTKDINENNTIYALTPGYASPEQIKNNRVSVTTDIFSLALVTLGLLIGDNPMSKDRVLKECKNDDKDINKHLNQLNTDDDLENILRKSLESDPTLRYLNMNDFALDLENWLTQKPVTATKQSSFYKLKKYTQRNTKLFLSFVSLFISLIIGLGTSLWQNQLVKFEAEKANQVKMFMVDVFNQSDPDKTKGEYVTAKDLLVSAGMNLNNASLNPNIKSDLFQSVGESFGKLGVYDQSISYLKQSLVLNDNNLESLSSLAEFLFLASEHDELEKLLSSIEPKKINSNIEFAKLKRVEARLQARKSNFDKAIELAQEAINLDLKSGNINETISSKRLLAEIYFYKSDTEEGLMLLNEILSNPNLDKSQMLMLDIRKELSEYLMEIGEYQKAQNELIQLVETQKQILGSSHPMLINSLVLLGDNSRNIGDIDKAQKTIDEAYKVSLMNFGEDSLKTALVYNSYGIIAFELRNFEDSINHFKQAVNIYENKLPDHSETLEIKTNLAAILNSTKRYGEALKLLEEIITVQKLKLGESHDSTLYTSRVLAITLRELGRLDEASNTINRAVEVALSALGNKHPVIANLIYDQGRIYNSKKEHSKALQTFSSIIDEEILNDNSPDYPKVLKKIAETFKRMKNLPEAEKHYLLSIQSYKKIHGNKSRNTTSVTLDYIELLLELNKKQIAYQQLQLLNTLVKESPKAFHKKRIEQLNRLIEKFN